MKKFILLSLALMLVASIFADVTIGTGTNNIRQPFSPYFGYERSAALYTAAEINATGAITHLGWHVGSAEAGTNIPIKIYLKTTTNTALTTTTWANQIASSTLVYNGTVIFGSTGWKTLDITDFLYNYQTSGNLLVMCETNYGGAGNSAYPIFFSSPATNRHQEWHADTTPPAGNGTGISNRPNITLYGITVPISSFPFVEGFENRNTDQSDTIANWTQATGPDYNGVYWTANSSASTYNRAPRTGAWNASLRYDGQSILSRPIQLTAGTEYAVELFARQDTDVATDANIAVNYSLNGVLAGLIIPQTGVINGDYQRFYGTFTPASTGVYAIHIHGWVNHYPWYLSLDDITIKLAVPILSLSPGSIDLGVAPANTPGSYQDVTVSNTGAGILNLTAANFSLIGANANQFQFTTGALPAALTAGQAVSIPVRFAPSSLGTKTATLRISYGGTNYDVALSGNAISETALFEGFEAGVIPANWTVINADGYLAVWNAQTEYPHSGSYSAMVSFESNTFQNDDWLITPPLKVTSTTTDNISFWMRSYSANHTDAWQVLISTTNTDPASFTMIDSGTGQMPDYVQKSYNLDSYGDAIIFLAIRYVGAYDWYLWVDDFVGPEVFDEYYSIVGLAGEAILPNHASLTWSGIYGRPGIPGNLRWDDGSPRGAAIASVGTYHAVIKFGTEVTASAAGMQLESVKIHLNEVPQTVVALKLWTGGDALLEPTAMIYQQAVSGLSIGWNNVVLTVPVSVDGSTALYVGFQIDSTSQTALPVSIDGLTGIRGRGNLLKGASWTTLSNAGVIGNWLIHAKFASAADTKGRNPAPILSIPVATNTNSDRAVFGFSVYRDGAQINSSPVHAFSYIDEGLAPGTYQYTIGSLVDNNFSSLSSPVSVNIPTPPPSLAIPFTENWDSGSFAANKWTAGSNNWRINSYEGSPVPSASFNWGPRVFDYSIPLHSYYIDATGIDNVLFSFDLNMLSNDTKSANVMTWEIWDGNTWNTLGSYSSLDGDLAWTHYAYDVSTHASNRDFRIRFVVSGGDSNSVNYWLLDNIAVVNGTPLPLPFTEDWSSGSFATNMWTPGSTNWTVGIDDVKNISEPAAVFNWNPRVYNYEIPLSSFELDATGLNKVQLSFYLSLDNYSTDAINVMTWQIWNGYSWNVLGSYNSVNGDLPWTRYAYNITSFSTNRKFKIRFIASGQDSFEIDQWYIDNISVSEFTPIAVPFYEDWASGDFATNQWTAGSENWISNQWVGSAGINYCAAFNPQPQLLDFNVALDSYYFDATNLNSVQLSFMLLMDNFNESEANSLSCEIWNGSSWTILDSHSSVAGWTGFTYDITAYAAHRTFAIRFVASGANSSDIDFWCLANIRLQQIGTIVTTVQDLHISQGSGQLPEDFLLYWTHISGTEWYLVQMSDNPYAGFAPLQVIQVNNPPIGGDMSVYLSASTLPQDKAFFKVIAGRGPIPNVYNVSNSPTRE